MALQVFVLVDGADLVAVEAPADGTIGELLAEVQRERPEVIGLEFRGTTLDPDTHLCDSGLSAEVTVTGVCGRAVQPSDCLSSVVQEAGAGNYVLVAGEHHISSTVELPAGAVVRAMPDAVVVTVGTAFNLHGNAELHDVSILRNPHEQHRARQEVPLVHAKPGFCGVVAGCTAKGACGCGIQISDAGGTFRDNVLTENRGSGFHIKGGEADPTLLNNICRENATGINCGSLRGGRFVQNTCTNNRGHGIKFGADILTSVTVSESVCSNNGQNGIDIGTEAGRIEVVGNEISSNGGIGINLSGCYLARTDEDAGPQGRFANNIIRANKKEGIVTWRSSAKFVHNTVSENGSSGFELSHSGRPVLEGNEIIGNGRDGICIRDMAGTVTIEGGRIQENSRHGVTASSVQALVVLRSSVEANGWHGVSIVGSVTFQEGTQRREEPSSLRLEHTTISKNRHRGLVCRQTHGLVAGNVVEGNENGGIQLGGGTTGDYNDNKVGQNGGDGVHIEGSGTKPVFRRNIVSENRGGGFFCASRAISEFAENEVSGNRGTGVMVTGGAEVVLDQDSVAGNRREGVRVDGVKSKLRAVNIDVNRNERSGLLCKSGAEVAIIGSRIHANCTDGAVISTGAQVQVEETVVAENTGSGFRVSGASTCLSEERNDIRGNGGGNISCVKSASPSPPRAEPGTDGTPETAPSGAP
eukprot:Hpha_TRINITY_DN3078_c0_g1::TRINITY_DN3078_c0_g1_i2::g.138504::m.138504/K10297/FBXO11; F-box protein 11